MSAALIAGSLAIGVGGGVASAQEVDSQGVIGSGATLFPGGQPNNIRQNTKGAESLLVGIPTVPQGAGLPTGAAQAVVLTIGDNWRAGDYFTLTVAPNSNGLGQPGANCKTPQQPEGVNQADRDDSNWVGFAPFTPGVSGTGVAPPSVASVFGGGPAPLLTISTQDLISCSTRDGQGGAYSTMKFLFTNSGPAAGSTVTLNIGTSAAQLLAPTYNGPILLSTGFGATTGPVQTWGAYTAAGSNPAATPVSFTSASIANVVGETPSANNPRTTLVRNTATDVVGGLISDFKITEGPSNSLPPTDGTPAANPPAAPATNLTTHQVLAYPSGFVCLSIDERPGFQLAFNPTATPGVFTNPGWSVTPSAGSAGNSAAAGDAKVVNNGQTVVLPVTSSSNSLTGAVWSTSGLTLGGKALTDGPVWAYAYWVQGDYNGDSIQCPPPSKMQVDMGDSAYILGYVQLTTVSEQANAVFGNNAEATAAQAINHQFDYAKGSCISNTVGRDFTYGPSIFLARSDYFADGLGAAYAAGTVESGVLLTPPDHLDSRTKDTIRLQGAQTVFVAGGPLAISDSVVNELKDTISYQCGGTTPRLDPNTGLPKKLVVIRIYGDTVWDTNARLAEFVGAEPPAAFGPFGANTPGGNPFNTAGGISQAGTPPVSQVNTALLVTGENFQDAMVASVAAYGGEAISPVGTGGPMPLIATPSASLSQQAIDAMFNQHIQQLIVVGGPLAVSDAVINQAIAAIPGLSVIRIAGANASATSVNLASFELAKAPVSLVDTRPMGMGWSNFDDQWDNYVNRTAGNINFNTNGQVGAHVVLMARGDWFADAMSAAAVLSVHNGRYNECRQGMRERDESEICPKFPLIITESPTSLGADVTSFLTKSSTAVSTLTGALPAFGYSSANGYQYNNSSSSVFTIQPIGGPLALAPSILSQAAKIIGS